MCLFHFVSILWGFWLVVFFFAIFIIALFLTSFFRYGLGNDQLTDIDLVLNKKRHLLLNVFHSPLLAVVVVFLQNHLKHSLQDPSDEYTIVPTHRLDTLLVNLVMLLWIWWEVKSRVTFLSHEQVGTVDLLELKFDRVHSIEKGFCDLLSCSFTIVHGLLYLGCTEFMACALHLEWFAKLELDHDWICVTVNDLWPGIQLFDLVLCL